MSQASLTHITGNVQRLRWSLTARIPTNPLHHLYIIFETNCALQNSLGTGVDTHREPFSALQRITSHLTSLRKKDKEKTERANEEGKRER